MTKAKNLLSSAGQLGEVVDEVIIMTSGLKKTYRGIKTHTIEQGEFTKFDLLDGRKIFVNTKITAFIEVYAT